VLGKSAWDPGSQDPAYYAGLPELRINVVMVEECRKETPTVHKEGCQRAFRAFLGRKVGAIGAVSVIAALLQILVIYASSTLVKKWRIPGQCYPCY